MKNLSNARKSLFLAAALLVLVAVPSFAETLNLTTLPTTTAGGYYVGAIGGNINGGTKANYYCIDFATTTYIPSSFAVLVSTLSDISGTKFAGQQDALKKYQQVGWLMYEMQINPSKIPALQFAMWSVFNPSTPTYQDSAYWLDASAKINPASYDFSNMRIYTPTGSKNQEFLGGSVSLAAVPEPAEWLLLFLGLGLISWRLRRYLPTVVPARMA